MKFVILAAAAALSCLAPGIASAQTAPAPAAAAAKFNLDTPIETLVADEQAKAVLTANLGGDVTTNPQYESFKAMSLTQVAPFAPDKLTAEVLKKVETGLAAIK